MDDATGDSDPPRFFHEDYQRDQAGYEKAPSNLVAVPLLIVAAIGIGFVLVWAEAILVPFVVALFFTYLLKPVVNGLTQPLGSCTEFGCRNFFSSRAGCRRRPPTKADSDPIEPHQPEYDAKESIEFKIRKPGNSDINGDLASLRSESRLDDVEVPKFGEDYNVTELRPRGQTSKSTDFEFGSLEGSFKPISMSSKGTVCFRCRNLRCPRWLAILLCVALVFGVLAGIVILIVDAVQDFETNHLEAFEERLVKLTVELKRSFNESFGVDINSALKEFSNDFRWVSLTKTFVVAVLSAVEYFFVVFLFVLYMLFETSDRSPARSSPRNNYEAISVRDVRMQIDHQIQRYLFIKTLISLIVGFLVFVVLGPILGVKMAHIFGVVTFFANYVPNVGAMIATILPAPVLILDESLSTINAILAMLLPMLLHSIVGNIAEPKIFGDTMELHPVVVLISLSFWYSIWGIPGAILSVPITAVIRIILSNMEHPYATVALRMLEGKLPGSYAFHGY